MAKDNLPRRLEPAYRIHEEGHEELIANHLPTKFRSGFVREMDKRTNHYKSLKKSFARIIKDLGDPEELSYIKRSLVEQFCYQEAKLKIWIVEMMENPKASERLQGVYTQALNSLCGLAKMIGIERKKPSKLTLKGYLKHKSA